MEKTIDQLSQLIIEADALLLLLHSHREETPSDALVMLRKKLQIILSLLDGIEEEEAEAVQITEVPSEPKEVAPLKDEDNTTTAKANEEIEGLVEGGEIEDVKADYSATEDPFWTKITDEIEDLVEGGNLENEQQKTEPVKTSVVEVNEPIEHPKPVEAQKPVEAPANYNPLNYNPLPIDEPEVSTVAPKPVNRRPIASIFNLNDKFRFRRELFGNSEIAYTECLNMLSAMKSLDEAMEYLYDDLAWDPVNEDVVAFVELLNNYY